MSVEAMSWSGVFPSWEVLSKQTMLRSNSAVIPDLNVILQQDSDINRDFHQKVLTWTPLVRPEPAARSHHRDQPNRLIGNVPAEEWDTCDRAGPQNEEDPSPDRPWWSGMVPPHTAEPPWWNVAPFQKKQTFNDLSLLELTAQILRSKTALLGTLQPMTGQFSHNWCKDGNLHGAKNWSLDGATLHSLNVAMLTFSFCPWQIHVANQRSAQNILHLGQRWGLRATLLVFLLWDDLIGYKIWGRKHENGEDGIENSRVQEPLKV